MKYWRALGVVTLVACGLLLLLSDESGACSQIALWAKGLPLLQGLRRLSVLLPQFSLVRPIGGNLADVASSSSNIVVVAGPSYASFTVTATSGLGNSANARVKLVSSTTIASQCSTVVASAPSPLDGTTGPSSFSATSETYSSVRFSSSGVFKICYFNPGAGSYELLPVTITVDGAVPSDDHFCPVSSSIDCMVKITGTGLGSFRIGLVAYSASASCGSSALTHAFGNAVSTLVVSQSTSSSQIHNLKKQLSVSPATYLLCLCPAFDADSTGGNCDVGSSADFAQYIGKLFTTTVTANVSNIYNGLGISLVVNCGAVLGGCTNGYSNRYKVADLSTANDAPAWDSASGCGTALQTQHQIKPRNCMTSVMCQHQPVSPNTLSPTWSSIILEGKREGQRHLTTTLDVCYCNSNCVAAARWFKVGQIQVASITVLGPSIVNTLSNVDLQGPGGSWITSGSVLQREMKLLSDPHGSISNAQCFQVKQSSQFVDSHTCSSLNDCNEPYSAAVGQTFIGVTVKAAGWAAVCYCNTQCGERGNWFVQGHLLVAGPIPGQTWSVYTSVLFNLEVQGWKLTTGNKILVIDSTVECTAAAALQHPAISGPSSVYPVQSSGTVGDITSIVRHGSQSKITFATDHGLVSGARISITGVTCGACTDDDRSKFNANHEIAGVLTSKEVLVSLAFAGAYPVAVLSSTTWLRDDLQTFGELVASQPGRYRVCWSSSQYAQRSVSATVGIIHVATAPIMSASLHTSTIEPSKVAPVVLTFTTSNTDRYQEAVGSMQLRIVFVNPSLLMPYFVDKSALSADASVDTLAEANQHACSKWILELGTARNPGGLTNDIGWPMPRGCYFVQSGSQWTFTIVFDPKNGLKQYQTYDIVFNAAVGPTFATTSDVVHIFSMDDIDHKLYDVIEAGTAIVGNGVATELRSGSDAEFHATDGFSILNGHNGYYELTGTLTSFQAQLRAATGTTIDAEHLVRVFLRPFTQWVVGYACFVTCTPFSGQICGTPSCITESVMKRWYHRNILRIKLPQGMTSVTNVIKHWLQITSLPTPPGGFFPLRWGAEVQPEEGKKPSYVDTTAALAYIRPAATVASVVSSLGDGNLKPFRGDQSNTLYVKVMLGASLFAANAGDAFLRVVLPPGYECVGGSAAPDNLKIFSDQVPTTNGILRDGTNIPSWVAVPSSGSARARCELGFAQDMALYAGVIMYFALTVNNPNATLNQDAIGNQWSLELSARSGLPFLITAPLLDFTNVNANLSRSVSVLGELSDASIVPSTFVRGASGNWLSIFFRTTQAVAEGGSVQVDCPAGFAVGHLCEVKDLPAYYYTEFDLSLSDENSSSIRLRMPFTSCVGAKLLSSSSTNSARITLSSGLLQGASYAFMLGIANPLSYHSSQLNSWYIQTNSPNGFGIDRTSRSIRMNGDEEAEAHSSWGMYNYQLGPSGFEVHIADMRPTGLPTKVRVFPIVFERDVNNKVRVIAPVGYSWVFNPLDFVYRKYSDGLTVGKYVQGAEEDMPLSSPPNAPTSAPYNQLEFDSISGYFRWGVKYGFEATVVLPQYNPSSSANVFILQAGYEDVALAGAQAAVAEAAFVRRISDVVVVSYTSSLKDTDSTVVINFRTLTEIPVGGGLSLHGPADFTGPMNFNGSCHLSFASGNAMDLPLHSCVLGNFTGNEAATVLALQAMPASAYRISVSVHNPISAGASGFWRVATYPKLSNYTIAQAAAVHNNSASDSQDYLDYEGSAPSFLIRDPMQGAGMVSGQFCLQEFESSCATIDQQYQKTGRDDRPGAQNNLIFSLNLSSNSTSGQFAIRAPEGFKWSPECTVVTDDVFGSFTTLPSNFSAWPNVSVSNCIGHKNVATFHVSHPPNQGFLRGEVYVFRINSVTNPLAAPVVNLWALEFSDEASEPFPGFALWTFAHLAIYSQISSVGSASTITLHLSVLHDVPVLGYVRIDAPGGYFIPNLCSLSLSTVIPVQPWEVNKIFFAGDFNCTGAQSNIARVYLLKKSLLSDVQYVIQLGVHNPSMASSGENAWTVASFRKIAHQSGKLEYEALDSGTVQGPTTQVPLSLFTLSPWPLTNALAHVDWEFWFVFGEDVRITDRIELVAPEGYVLDNTTAGECSQYHALLGLPGTSNVSCNEPCYHTASCHNNTLLLRFERCPSYTASVPFGVCIQKNSRLKFEIATQNPSSAPGSNYFNVRHKTVGGIVHASSVLPSYPIIPLIGNPQVELVAAGVLNVVSESVGSSSTIRISFIANGLAQTVRIYGNVAGESFRFSSCTPYVCPGAAADCTSDARISVTVNERESSKIIVTLPSPVDVGGSVNLLLGGMGNPSNPGSSSWTVTTFSYYDAVLGPMIVVNEKLSIAGFDVLGYISVLTTSSLNPRYYGTFGCVLSLDFTSSLQLGQGDFVDIYAPRNYVFESSLLNVSGDLMVADIVVVGSSSGQASGLLGNYTMVSDVAPYLSTYLAAGGTSSDLVPIYQKNDSLVFLYRLPGGQQWAIGPTPGNQVSGLSGEGLLSVPSLSGETAAWQVGNGSAWLQAPDVYVSAAGVVTSPAYQEQLLTFRLGRQLPAASTAKIAAKLSLPSVEQETRNWRLEARQSTGTSKAYATNDLQYGGFNLVWEITFTVIPALTAPKSQSTLTLAFDQERRLQATTQVTYELIAPNSYRFPTSCLSAAEAQRSSKLFGQCVGSANAAELLSTDPESIKGRQDTLRVELIVNMPEETPLLNAWILTYLLDAEVRVQGSGSAAGFNIVPMVVSMKGNNQLGMNAPAYFTLRPLRVAKVGSSIHIMPPANQQYSISCYPVVQVNFPTIPGCGISPTTGALVLTLQPSAKPGGGQLDANRDYTVGVGVTNNGRSIPDAMNRWTLVLYDTAGDIKDSNYEVQGVQLRSFRMSVENAVLQSVLPDGSYQVVIQLKMTHALAGGMVSQMLVIPPSNFAITNNQWKVSYALPTSSAPQLLSTGSLQIPLSDATLPAGSHSIEVSGTVSGAGDIDTTWTFMALKGNEVVYQHVLSGLTS